jgi:Transglycosylase
VDAAAVVDAEDARFWSRGGVDWVAVARAAARDLERRRVVEGGSTITQQYVKNSYVSGERTLRRKLAEAGHAWGLERRIGKEAILEAYLNTVYFGQGAYGVEAAAQAYFSTGADRLTLTQAALLAGLIRAPAAYDRFRHPPAARARRASVLARMERYGDLSRALAARGEPPRPSARGPATRRPPPRPGPAGRQGRRGGPPGHPPGALVRELGARPAAGPGRPPLRRARNLEEDTDRPRVHRRAADHHHRRPAGPGGGRAGGGRGRRRTGRDPYGALVAVEPGTGRSGR